MDCHTLKAASTTDLGDYRSKFAAVTNLVGSSIGVLLDPVILAAFQTVACRGLRLKQLLVTELLTTAVDCGDQLGA